MAYRAWEDERLALSGGYMVQKKGTILQFKKSATQRVLGNIETREIWSPYQSCWIRNRVNQRIMNPRTSTEHWKDATNLYGVQMTDYEDLNKLLTVKELAERLRVPPSWIYQRSRFGQEGIPHLKVGKYLRFNFYDVIKFLKSKEQMTITNDGNPWKF